jgi:hypothetical protein
MALGSTLPLRDMSIRSLPGGEERLALKTDKLTAICEPIVKKCGSLDVSQHYRFARPVTGIASAFKKFIEVEITNRRFHFKYCNKFRQRPNGTYRRNRNATDSYSMGVYFESRPDPTQNLSGLPHFLEIGRGDDKSLALSSSYFSIWSKTKIIFLG